MKVATILIATLSQAHANHFTLSTPQCEDLPMTLTSVAADCGDDGCEWGTAATLYGQVKLYNFPEYGDDDAVVYPSLSVNLTAPLNAWSTQLMTTEVDVCNNLMSVDEEEEEDDDEDDYLDDEADDADDAEDAGDDAGDDGADAADDAADDAGDDAADDGGRRTEELKCPEDGTYGLVEYVTLPSQPNNFLNSWLMTGWTVTIGFDMEGYDGTKLMSCTVKATLNTASVDDEAASSYRYTHPSAQDSILAFMGIAVLIVVMMGVGRMFSSGSSSTDRNGNTNYNKMSEPVDEIMMQRSASYGANTPVV